MNKAINDIFLSWESLGKRGEGRGGVGTKRSNIEPKWFNLVQTLLDTMMPEIQNINTIAFQTKLQCQGLSRLVIFGSPLISFHRIMEDKFLFLESTKLLYHKQDSEQISIDISG